MVFFWVKTYLCYLEYYFVSREEFEEAIKRQEFIEYAEFSGNLYGTRYGRIVLF